MESEAYKQGKASHSKKRYKISNPFKMGTEEYNDFERGWIQQLKLSPYEPLNTFDDSKYFEHKEGGIVKRTLSESEVKTKKAYKNRKG